MPEHPSILIITVVLVLMNNHRTCLLQQTDNVSTDLRFSANFDQSGNVSLSMSQSQTNSTTGTTPARLSTYPMQLFVAAIIVLSFLQTLCGIYMYILRRKRKRQQLEDRKAFEIKQTSGRKKKQKSKRGKGVGHVSMQEVHKGKLTTTDPDPVSSPPKDKSEDEVVEHETDKALISEDVHLALQHDRQHVLFSPTYNTLQFHKDDDKHDSTTTPEDLSSYSTPTTKTETLSHS